MTEEEFKAQQAATLAALQGDQGDIDQQQAAQLPDEQTQMMQYLQQQQMPQIPMPAANYQALINQYGQKQQEALAQEQIGIDQLKQYQRQLQSQNGAAQDWILPLASIGESLGGPKTVDALRASGIETPQERQGRVIALQEKIQDYQNKATKGNLEALKTQLQSYVKSQVNPLDNRVKESRIALNNSLSGTRADGKVLPETAVGKISDFDASLDELKTVRSDLEANADIMGPIEGTLKSLNPFDVQAQKLQADLDKAKQVIGKGLEGGVLRKEDEEKYKKMLPKMGDMPDVARHKMEQFQATMIERRRQYTDNLGRAGYNTKNFKGTPEAAKLKRLEELRQKERKARGE